MNARDYGRHASGYRKADGGPTRRETLAFSLCMTFTILGFLTLLFQPYAGPWSIIAGFMLCSPVALCFALDDE